MLLGVMSASAAPPRLERTVHLWGDAMLARAPRSWLDGGFGRLDAGEKETGEGELAGRLTGEIGIDFHASENVRLHAHVLTRAEAPASGDRSGFVEAYLEWKKLTAHGELRTRGGAFFLPTSRENVEALWSSPYTSTFSAVNSWMAHEVRPIGVDAEWRIPVAETAEVRLAGTVFGGNDSMGSLLAWRGWSLSRRVSLLGEVLPLPPLASLRDPEMFGRQRSDGTRPLGNDLDGRAGYSARVRWQLPSRASVQLLHLDTRGDRALHDGEYAWATRFDHLAAEWNLSPRTTVAGEWLRGESGMGDRNAAFVQIDFESKYLLLSHTRGRARYSVRGEDFEVRDRDHSAAENDDDDGQALTAAVRLQWNAHVATTLELLEVQGEHAAAPESERRRNHRAGTVAVDLTF
jgi:hypothetical protein